MKRRTLLAPMPGISALPRWATASPAGGQRQARPHQSLTRTHLPFFTVIITRAR